MSEKERKGMWGKDLGFDEKIMKDNWRKNVNL